MKFNPLSKSAHLLLMAAATLAPLAAAHAIDLFDSLKAWDRQAADERKFKESQQAVPPSLQPETTSPGNSGAQGPIRSDMSDDQPPLQQTPSSSDENRREPATSPSDEIGGQQILNSPHMPSP